MGGGGGVVSDWEQGLVLSRFSNAMEEQVVVGGGVWGRAEEDNACQLPQHSQNSHA